MFVYIQAILAARVCRRGSSPVLYASQWCVDDGTHTRWDQRAASFAPHATTEKREPLCTKRLLVQRRIKLPLIARMTRIGLLWHGPLLVSLYCIHAHFQMLSIPLQKTKHGPQKLMRLSGASTHTYETLPPRYPPQRQGQLRFPVCFPVCCQWD